MKRFTIIIFMLICSASFAFGAVAVKQDKGNIWAASDGRGNIALFWVPANSAWPAGGWQLERLAGGKAAVIAKKIIPGLDEEAMRSLDPRDASGIQTFAGKMKTGSLASDEGKLAGAVFGLKAATDTAFGRAMGLRFTDNSAGSGSISYRLTALDSSGRPGAVLQSATVDPSRATALPEQIKDLKASQDNEAVRLSWSVPLQNKDIPVIAYHIERSAGTAKEVLTAQPLLIGSKTDKQAAPSFLDQKPPVEADITYSVSTVDFFGRKGTPAQVRIYIPDKTALMPPTQVIAKAGDGRVDLSWKRNSSQFTTGYIVERAMLYGGPYENLTPKGLKRDEEKFRDIAVMGGSQYYYRVRSVDPRGNAGHPSDAAMAQPQSEDRSPAPEGLKAQVGNTRIRLTWEPVKFPVAGYFVYRQTDGSEHWTQFNERLTPESVYDIAFGEHNGAVFRFRVTAVGFDSKESKPSRQVEVLLPDNLSPNVPLIRAISGAGGKAVIDFVPANPEQDTHQFLILRSGSDKDLGVVIGDPLPANARRFEDPFVDAGQEYWYRIVALDKTGNRSDLSRPVVIQIGTPEIPTPKKPVLTLTTSPFRHVKISFDPPPFGLSVIVESRKGNDQDWKKVTGPVSEVKEATDPSPGDKGKAQYRIVYRAANGALGKPSDPGELELK
ncbi:MAG: hypothetical protein Q8K68_05090 [Nitrospirota bacterium]|nr:hypothetical protein [Nitrospirota bacterium]